MDTELVGFRGPQDGLLNPGADLELPGLLMRNWPASQAGRRTALSCPSPARPWMHRPAEPDTCLVCDDINTIVARLLEQQPDPAPPPDDNAVNEEATTTTAPSRGSRWRSWRGRSSVLSSSPIDCRPVWRPSGCGRPRRGR